MKQPKKWKPTDSCDHCAIRGCEGGCCVKDVWFVKWYRRGRIRYMVYRYRNGRRFTVRMAA